LAAVGGLPRCKRTQIQAADRRQCGLYLRSLTSRPSARCARRPIERSSVRLRSLRSSC